MSAVPRSVPVRSLDAAGTGEAVLIRRILFEALRSLCHDLGIHEGDVVHCRAGTNTRLWLETPAGRTVAIERGWARFIQVEEVACSPAGPASTLELSRPAAAAD